MRRPWRLFLAGCHGKVMQLPMGRRIARPAADHQQHGIFRWHRGERCQRLVAALLRECEHVGMKAQGLGLPHDEPRPRGAVANRLGYIPSGMPCGEKEEWCRHDLSAPPGCQTLERLANRRTDHLQEPQLHGDIREHRRHQGRDPPRLLGPHRVGRSMPHDHHSPRSPAPPAAGVRSPFARAFPKPISGGRSMKEPAKRAFHEATGGTGGEEWHGERPFGRRPIAGRSAEQFMVQFHPGPFKFIVM